VLVGTGGGKHMAVFDFSNVRSLTYKLGGVVRMLVMCIVSSSYGLCAACAFDND